MHTQHTSHPELIATLRRLCEYETPQGNEMLCHDGGYRYAGDFESLELTPLNAPELLAGPYYGELLRLGYIEETPDGFRVTARGRAAAFEDS
jgi:hypothetical protein